MDMPQIDPDSDAIVGGLADLVDEQAAEGRAPYLGIGETGNGGGAPIVVPAGQPLVPVLFPQPGRQPTALQRHVSDMGGWPIPLDAVPSGENDAIIAVVQPELDRYFELFRARRVGDSWAANHGGASLNYSTRDAFDKTSWPPYSTWQWGVSGSGIFVSRWHVRFDELAAGLVDHPIALFVPQAGKGKRPPATRDFDGTAPPPAPSYGTTFWLPPDAPIPANPYAAALARACQPRPDRPFGLVVREETHDRVVVAAAPDRQGGSLWQQLLGGHGTVALDGFPWRSLKVLAPPPPAG